MSFTITGDSINFDIACTKGELSGHSRKHNQWERTRCYYARGDH
jgi:hypothetical protein